MCQGRTDCLPFVVSIFQGKYKEAELLFRRVLTNSERVVGGEDTWYTYGLDHLAGVLSEQV